MGRFKDSHTVAEIAPRGHPESTDQSGAQAGEGAAEGAREQDIEVLRPPHELQAEDVGGFALELNVWVFLAHLLAVSSIM
jgi:hypothetical protein